MCIITYLYIYIYIVFCGRPPPSLVGRRLLAQTVGERASGSHDKNSDRRKVSGDCVAKLHQMTVLRNSGVCVRIRKTNAMG